MINDQIQSANVLPIRISDKTIWRHVILSCNNGQNGVGEFTLNTATGDLDLRMVRFARRLIGLRPADIILSQLLPDLEDSLSDHTILSALDQALYALKAKAEGLSLGRLLNPQSSLHEVALYANVNRRTTDRSPQGFSRSARRACDAGYAFIKIAPFDGVDPVNCETATGERLIEAGLDRISAVSDLLPENCELRVDCHWRFSPSRAGKLVGEVAQRNVKWLECPIAETRDSVSDLCRLRSQCAAANIRLAGCESMYQAAGFEPFIRARAYDVIMPDVKHAGGLDEIIRIARMAEDHGIAVSLHNPSGPVAHLHSVQVTAALQSREALEIQFDESTRFFELTKPRPMIENGFATVPSESCFVLAAV